MMKDERHRLTDMTRGEMLAYLEDNGHAWTRPDSYMGAEWHGWYRLADTNRDADTVTRSNWDEWLQDMRPWIDPDDDAIWVHDDDGEMMPPVRAIRESHWAVGWVEWLGIHRDAPTDALAVAVHNLLRLEDYPVLNEDAWTELEYDEVCDAWDDWGSRETRDAISEQLQAAGMDPDAARDTAESAPDDELWGILQGGSFDTHHGHAPVIPTDDIAAAWLEMHRMNDGEP